MKKREDAAPRERYLDPTCRSRAEQNETGGALPISPHLEVGELYLFHPSDPSCPSDESLWGCYGSLLEDRIWLESSTVDLSLFRLDCELPKAYSYHRFASRSELRDYTYALATFENQRHGVR